MRRPTFASLTLTFLTGALLYDHGVDRTEKMQLVARLLEIELSAVLGLLGEERTVEVRLTLFGRTASVVPSRLETPTLTDAAREGFFKIEGAAEAMRLLVDVAARRVLVHDLLLPALLSGAPEVLRAIVEDTTALERRVERTADLSAKNSAWGV